MSAQHTLGPWQAKVGLGRWNVTTVNGQRTFNICAINTNFPGQEDIAHLIAAAPDLLVALELAEKFVAKFEDDEDYTDGQVETLNAIRAAIAKAASN